MAKMNKDVKKKWLAALRSGKFKQGKGMLRTENNEFCCLGVLCEIARVEGVIPNPVHAVPNWDNTGKKAWFYGKGSIADGRRNGTLPDEVRAWAGLEAGNPWIGENTAAHWNDGAKKSFVEIADLVEEHL
jgi:hypothetical protein